MFSPSVAGWPKLLWFVTESKHLSKPPRDWFPHIKDANNDTAYIEVKPHTRTHWPRFRALGKPSAVRGVSERLAVVLLGLI